MLRGVSVVVPVHDGERFLEAALESILGQGYAPLDVVVVDDGSTDRTAAILDGYGGVRVVTQAQAGPAAARNAGMRLATGEAITFLDADDQMPPGRIALQAAYLEQHPDVDAVLGRQEIVVEAGVEPPAWVAHAGDLRRATLVQPMTIMARRSVFDRVGLFDETYALGEDSDWLFRVWDAGLSVVVLDDVLLRRRIHGHNLTYDTLGSQRALLRALKARADRRRAARRSG